MSRPNYPVVCVDGIVKRTHVFMAEKAIGRPLPVGAVVHHVDCDVKNNKPSNLVICPSQAYHKLLHQRMDAIAACGHADWRKCWLCKKYDSPSNLSVKTRIAEHRSCAQEYERQRPKRVKYIKRGYSPGHFERLRALHLGRKRKPETIERMRASALKREAKKREARH